MRRERVGGGGVVFLSLLFPRSSSPLRLTASRSMSFGDSVTRGPSPSSPPLRVTAHRDPPRLPPDAFLIPIPISNRNGYCESLRHPPPNTLRSGRDYPPHMRGFIFLPCIHENCHIHNPSKLFSSFLFRTCVGFFGFFLWSNINNRNIIDLRDIIQ